jgi:integrase
LADGVDPQRKDLGRDSMAGKTVKLATGTVYQKKEGGKYYFRYQLNGQRKAVCLQTRNREEAIEKAKEFVPVVNAPTVEIIAAHVSHAKSLTKEEKRIELGKAWDAYDLHPDRANPATVNIYQRYRSYFQDFVDWAKGKGYTYLDEITDSVVAVYVKVLKRSQIGVDTHNKRIARVSHIFRTLSEYCRADTSDWTNRSFRRKAREEIGMTARRLPFTKEQEEQIFAVFEDPGRRFANKHELRVLFYLGALTGQRLKDCALLQWHNVDLRRHRISVAQFKTGKEVTIPIAPRLLEVLREAQEWQDNTYVLPAIAKRYQRKDANGKDNGPGFVNHDVIRVIKWSGLEPSVKVPGRTKAVTVYGFHSLRHSFVSFCIDHNIPKAVCVSILGADSDIIDQYYTHVGEAAQEQAIQLISGNTTSLKQRHERAIAYLDSITDKSAELIAVERLLRGETGVGSQGSST